MPYNPDRHHRRSLRLPGYDYRSAGAYFVTICTQNRVHRFGTVSDATVKHNAAGLAVCTVWQSLPVRFAAVRLDSWILMPNHLHAIVWLVAIPETVQPQLGDVVGAFKSLSTTAYIAGVRQQNWPPFAQRLWQRNYYEHIVRDADDLARIQAYVAANPAQWSANRLS